MPATLPLLAESPQDQRREDMAKSEKPKADPKTEVARISRVIMKDVRVIAAALDMSVPDWLEATLAPIVRQQLIEVSAQLNVRVRKDEENGSGGSGPVRKKKPPKVGG